MRHDAIVGNDEEDPLLSRLVHEIGESQHQIEHHARPELAPVLLREKIRRVPELDTNLRLGQLLPTLRH